MKKALLIIFSVLITTLSQAQETIEYYDFNPDLSIAALTANNYGDTIKIDLDQDGVVDFNMYIGVLNSTMVRYVFVNSTWYFRFCYNSIYSYGYQDENDTLVSEPHYPGIWGNPNGTWALLWEPDNTNYMEFLMGFRKVVNNDNYYAWAKIYMYRNPNGKRNHTQHGDFDIVTAYCDNMVYCTIPNYPLRWGQTSLDETSLNENVYLFASIQPNPTNNQFTITGKDLKFAVIFNALGQKVASTQGEGNQLTLDLSAQPAGIYFVNITDSEGRKCVRKVLKK